MSTCSNHQTFANLYKWLVTHYPQINSHLFIFVDDFSGIDPSLEAKEIRKHGKEFWLSKYIFGDTPPKINSSNLKMDALEDDFHGSFLF